MARLFRSYGKTKLIRGLSVPPLTQTLQDNFDDNSLDTIKWTSGGTVAESSQQLSLTGSSGGANYSVYVSRNYYNLTGSYVYSQLINSGNQALTTFQAIPAYVSSADGTNSLAFYISNGLIAAQKQVAGSFTDIRNDTSYNSAVHKWFRVRESGGTTFWDYSTDGTTWTNYTSAANPIAVTSVVVKILAGMFGSEGSNSTAIFDNFNTPPSGTAYTQTYTETIVLSDIFIRVTAKVLTDTLTLSEVFSKVTSKVYAETLTITDSLVKTAQKVWSETLTITDVFTKAIVKVVTFTETLVLTDTFTKVTSKVFAETLTLSEVFTKFVSKTWTETLTLSEVFSKTLLKTWTETLTITDTFSKVTQKLFSETLTLTDIFSRVGTFARTFTETLTITDIFSMTKNGVSQLFSFISRHLGNTTNTTRHSSNSTLKTRNSNDSNLPPRHLS